MRCLRRSRVMWQSKWWKPLGAHGTRHFCSKSTTTATTTTPSATSAAMICIGDEILTGKTHDVNTLELAKFCFEKGIRMKEVRIVRDDANQIKQSLLDLCPSHTYVFTSGGIGPTHDDITYEAVASTFGVDVELDQTTVDALEHAWRLRHPNEVYSGTNDARKRMAMFPEGSNIMRSPAEEFWTPIVNIRNVYVLPGVPSMFSMMLQQHASHFQSGVRLHRVLVYTPLLEGDLATPLRSVAESFPTVQIGSYPVDVYANESTRVVNGEKVIERKPLTYNVKVCLEGEDDVAVWKARDMLLTITREEQQ